MSRQNENGTGTDENEGQVALPEEAVLFLAQFVGQHTFQTVDDRKVRRHLARVLHDPAELNKLNAQGAGVFLMVNEGDGKGRKNVNVTRIRAYCADFDGTPLPPHWLLKPSIIVETSKGKYHAYWNLLYGETVPLDNAAYNLQQRAIALPVGSQPDDCVGLCNTMRMPGFKHQKGEPFTSRIVSLTEERYTLAEIQAVFPVPVDQRRPGVSARPRRPIKGSTPNTQEETRRKYALTALYEMADELSATAENGRNNQLNLVSFKIGRLVGGGHLDRSEVEAVLTGAARQAGLTDSEISDTLNSGLTAGIAHPNLLELVGRGSIWDGTDPSCLGPDLSLGPNPVLRTILSGTTPSIWGQQDKVSRRVWGTRRRRL